MDQHSAKVQQCCRVCGSLLVAKEKGKSLRPSYMYKCTDYSDRLNIVSSTLTLQMIYPKSTPYTVLLFVQTGDG